MKRAARMMDAISNIRGGMSSWMRVACGGEAEAYFRSPELAFLEADKNPVIW
jgi:hypothetical protein